MKVKLMCFAAILSIGWLATDFIVADQVELVASQDNTLYENENGDVSNGSGQRFFCGVTLADEIRRGLIKFDIAGAIPAGSVIDNVELTLNCSNVPPNGVPADVSLHVVLADWGEGASDANGAEGQGTSAEPGDATWLHTFFDTDFWATAGGDFVGTASAIETTEFEIPYTWTSAQMIADVQTWLDNPTSNFGWLVLGDESFPGSARRWDSRENGNENNRPILTVNFTPPGPIEICPDTATVTAGATFSGSSADICDEDSAIWTLQSTTFAAAFSPAPIAITFEGNTNPVVGGTDLTLRLVGGPDFGNDAAFIQLRMFNFTTQAYVGMPFISQPNSDNTVYEFTNPVADFVGPNGELRAEITCAKTVAGPVRLRMDQAVWQIQ